MRKNLQQLFDEFIYYSEFTRRVSPFTLISYKESYNLLCKLIPDLSVNLINRQTIYSFFETLQKRNRIVGKGIIINGVKASTISGHANRLSAFFTYLASNGYIESNPIAKMKLPTPRYDDRKFLEKEAIEKIFTAIHSVNSKNLFLLKRDLALFNLALFTGLRKEELMLLQIRDIDFAKKQILVRAENSKSGRSRTLPLHHSASMYLRDYLMERRHYQTQYVFASSKQDRKLTYEGLKKLIRKIAIQSGVQFHMHQFRHTFAVNFLKSSNNLAKLKQLLGHNSINVTLVYLRCMPSSEITEDIEGLSIDRFV